MGRTSKGLRAIFALGSSLAFHALLVGWVVRRPLPPPVVPEVVAVPPAVDFEVAVPVANAPTPAAASRHDHKAHHAAAHKAPVTGPQGNPGPGSTSDEAFFAAPGETSGTLEGRKLELKVVLSDPAKSEGLLGGETARFGDFVVGETPAQRDHADARQAHRTVTGWFEDYAATHRVETGLVAPYFEELALSLRTATEHPPRVPIPGGGVGAVVKKWADESARYGATGNPYTPEESPGRPDLPDVPGLHPKENASFDLLKSLPSGLVAVVEITQQADGHLLQSVLLRSSGSSTFDSYVLGAIPDGLARLAAPPDGGLGLHPDRLRSVWSFEGRTTFEHRWKDFHWSDDGWYFLATAPLMLLGGAFSFDEVTGEGGYPDLRHAKMLCDVKLLQVY